MCLKAKPAKLKNLGKQDDELLLRLRLEINGRQLFLIVSF